MEVGDAPLIVGLFDASGFQVGTDEPAAVLMLRPRAGEQAGRGRHAGDPFGHLVGDVRNGQRVAAAALAGLGIDGDRRHGGIEVERPWCEAGDFGRPQARRDRHPVDAVAL
ncbi:MAG: hypothetical protein M3552_21495 [Planctomycetota bacterium]|nr:hypothetical protein [Planctomycetota bacterium]